MTKPATTAQPTELDPRLTLPLSLTLAGSSASGKTELAKYILLNQEKILRQTWTRIYWVCRYAQSDLEAELSSQLPITFLEAGVIPQLEDLAASPGERILVTVDDLMDSATSSDQINRLFTAGRHLGMSVFFMTQNLFCAGRYARNIRLNTNYLILFRSLHDRQQISTYFRQMSPANWRHVFQAYEDATAANFAYFMIDFRVTTSQMLRFRTQIHCDSQTLYDIKL
jgi:hypothetical protein